MTDHLTRVCESRLESGGETRHLRNKKEEHKIREKKRDYWCRENNRMKDKTKRTFIQNMGGGGNSKGISLKRRNKGKDIRFDTLEKDPEPETTVGGKPKGEKWKEGNTKKHNTQCESE